MCKHWLICTWQTGIQTHPDIFYTANSDGYMQFHLFFLLYAAIYCYIVTAVLIYK